MSSPTRTTVALVLTLAFALGGCASSGKSRVMLREGGLTEAVGSGKKEEDALVNAIDAAQEHCEKRDKTAIFLDRDQDQKSKCPETAADKAIRAIERLPFVAKVLQGDSPQVMLPFRCG